MPTARKVTPGVAQSLISKATQGEPYRGSAPEYGASSTFLRAKKSPPKWAKVALFVAAEWRLTVGAAVFRAAGTCRQFGRYVDTHDAGAYANGECLLNQFADRLAQRTGLGHRIGQLR